VVEEERENDAMIERSLLREGVGETRGVPKIDRRRVGDGVEFSVGNPSRFHVWRWECDDAVLSASSAGSRMSAGT
jgi:hypothetical protein